jgi:hypothetical protein
LPVIFLYSAGTAGGASQKRKTKMIILTKIAMPHQMRRILNQMSLPRR